MNSKSLIIAIFNWLGGLVGTVALLAGLSFLPGVFGRQDSDQVFLIVSNLPLSTDILSLFTREWSIGLIVVATVLFVFTCLFLSMSTHSMVVSVLESISSDHADGEFAAWGLVFAINLSLVILFIVILYGTLLNGSVLLVGGLMLLAMASLLVANYAEIKAR